MLTICSAGVDRVDVVDTAAHGILLDETDAHCDYDFRSKGESW